MEKKLEPQFNTRRAFRTAEDDYNDRKQYKETEHYKDQSNKYRRRKVPCDKCGKIMSYGSISRHRDSPACIKIQIINNNNCQVTINQ